MPRPRSTPTYCVHRASGQAYVTIAGRQHQLGKAHSPESHEAYNRLIGEWWSAGRRMPEPAAAGPPQSMTVNMLAERFWGHLQSYYRKPDGTPATELACFRPVIRLVRSMYGSTEAASFGPLAYKAVREAMIHGGEYTDPRTGETIRRQPWARRTINNQCIRLRQMFRWGAENELLSPTIYQALLAVPGLRQGRTDAREPAPVRPVAEAMVERTLPYLSRPVAAMVKLELLCGARSGELCILRGRDLDMTGAVWIYRPAHHKTAHHGHRREIHFGPQAQEIIRPFLKLDPDAYLFSPREAEADRRAKMTAARKTPKKYGNRPGTNRKKTPKNKPGERYTSESYRRAVSRACLLAFPAPAELLAGPDAARKLKAWRKEHHWHPHQLRHTAATRLRKTFGVEGAGVILGHANLNVTEIYAERNCGLAARIMGEVG